MASVNELIAAAEAEKSPFVSMLEGVAGGYYNAQQRRPENDLRRVQMMAQMQEIEQKKQETEWQRMMMDAYKKQEEERLSASSKNSTGPLPEQKLQSVIEVGARGGKLRYITPSQVKTSTNQLTVYEDAEGKRRYGTYDKTTGKIIQSQNDAFAPMPRSAGSSGKAGLSSDRMLNKDADAMARRLYVNAHPELIINDVYGVPTGRNTFGPEHQNTEEFKTLLKQSVAFLSNGPDALQPKASHGQQFTPTLPGAAPIYATNPKTGERVVSTDGGNTWKKVQ